MSVSLDSPQQRSTNPFTHLLNSISSYDGNVMLAAVISLLCVILFVLLLHAYAKWFLAQARQRTTHHHQPTVSHVFRPHDHRFHHFHAFTTTSFETSTTAFFSSQTKGLDSSVISSIPLFVYKVEEYNKHGLECVICLSGFEENEVGRTLPKCGHGFHVECIDMWLNSHSNCPICRAPVLSSVVSSLADSEEVSSNNSLEIISTSVGEVGVVVIDGNSRLEDLITTTDHLSDSSNRAAVNDDDNQSSISSSPSSSLTLSSTLGCSLKRMLSRNRSERKVFPSSNTSELQV